MAGVSRQFTMRLLSVLGAENRKNDMIYHPPAISNETSDNVTVFFGGDVQDFPEIMKMHQHNSEFLVWNLENTAELLHNHFPNSHILVIRPSRFAYKTFSCYQNFVPSSDYGVPEHVPMYKSVLHLQKLMENLPNILREKSDNQVEISNKFMENVNLVGFSKGCVVLNQFLHEFHSYSTGEGLPGNEFVQLIREIYWLDGGHSGGKNTWITNNEILKHYASLGLKTYIHVTPYQIGDEKRPWIKKEEKIFYNTLKKLNANVHRTVHFQEIPASLKTHFELLNKFMN